MNTDQEIHELAIRLNELRVKAEKLTLAEEREMAEIQTKIEELEQRKIR